MEELTPKELGTFQKIDTFLRDSMIELITGKAGAESIEALAYLIAGCNRAIDNGLELERHRIQQAALRQPGYPSLPKAGDREF